MIPDLGRLYEQHAAAITRYADRLLGSREDAEDVCGAVFVRALEATYIEQGYARTWLFRVAHDRCIDILRRRHRRATESLNALPGWAELIAHSPGPEDVAARLSLAEALSQMTDVQRRVFWLHCIEGRTLDETAQACGCSIAAVKARYYRAKAYVRAAFLC